MTRASSQTTGGDSLEGVDPGGTHSTRPGNPDKSGPKQPREAGAEQAIVSGDRNGDRPDDLARDPK